MAQTRPERSGQFLTIQRVEPIRDSGVVATCPVQEADGRLSVRGADRAVGQPA